MVQKILGRKGLLAERGEEEEGADGADDGGTAVRGVILVPTRELCTQVARVLDELTYYCAEQVKAVVLTSSHGRQSKKGRKNGGEHSALQQEVLLRDRPDIVVATPAGLVTHVRSGRLNLKRSVETLVVDEADLILSFGACSLLLVRRLIATLYIAASSFDRPNASSLSPCTTTNSNLNRRQATPRT